MADNLKRISELHIIIPNLRSKVMHLARKVGEEAVSVSTDNIKPLEAQIYLLKEYILELQELLKKD